MKKTLKDKFSIIEKLFINMGNDNVGEYSAQCAYYTILSFIPFIILLITLIQYTNIDQQTLFNVFLKLIPESMSEMVLGIVREVYSKSFGTVSISIIFIIWSAGKGLYALNKGLHAVYNTSLESSLDYIILRLKAIVQTILFIVLIAGGLTLLVFGSSLRGIIQNNFGGLKNYNIYMQILTQVVYIFVTFIVFLFLYKYMPGHKVKFRSQTYGALFGAITLNVVSYVFSKYLDIFKGFSLTYGSLTTLMLIMMWTYSCFYTVFLGAEFNKLIGNRKKQHK